jgi:ferric-dicitrate binding protein FerR (iron transport regulator)
MKDNKDTIRYKIKMLKELDADIRENKEIDVSAGYKQTRLKIQKQSRTQWIRRTLTRAAAIAVVPLLVSTFTLAYIQIRESRARAGAEAQAFTEITAVPGAIVKTTLPDKSEVWLNSGTTLRYPNRFAPDKREVTLTGEAFFSVKTNPEHPFEVTAFSGIKVIARGTAFNVNACEEEAFFEAVLQNGRIDVIRNAEKVVLFPGEIAFHDRLTGHLHKSAVNIDEKTGWEEGLLIFRNASLDDVFKRLSQRYNMQIILHKETTVDYRIRATFSTETLEQILDVLKIAAPITWSVQKAQPGNHPAHPRQCIEVWVK